MTEHHSITPPPELVQQWYNRWNDSHGEFGTYLTTQAANWGADAELDACCEWMRGSLTPFMPDQAADQLRAARRPKPPTLAEQALAQLESIRTVVKMAYGGDFIDEPIRTALERLKELEQND